MSESIHKTCSRCDKKKGSFEDSWYRNLHPGFDIVCYPCHVELCVEKGLRNGKEEKAKEA